MAGMPGRSGGARPGTGGARPGAGRKPKLIIAVEVKSKPVVATRIKRSAECLHEKPLFSNGKARLKCFVCDPKVAPSERKPYGFDGGEAECKLCKKVFVKRQYHQAHCGAKCRNKFSNDAGTLRRSAVTKTERSCQFCKAVFTPSVGDRRQKYCSVKCSKQERSGTTARRRTRKYGGKYEGFSKWAIFERDGWTCKICGVQTPKSLSGLWLPNSPELDHIIPLAKGGDHIKSNVQCACASCNRQKGASLQFLKARTIWHEAATDLVRVAQ